MSLLTPLALVFLALTGPIIVLYILRLRRPTHVISSTILWQRTLEDVQANAPWQRLRPNLLLLLQLIAVALLVLTLAHPAYSRSGVYAGNLVVIVDQSFEMQARDVLPSRFAAAVARAHTLANSLASGAVMSVIGMGAQPTLAIARSSDQGSINQAIDTLHVTLSPPDFLRAFSLAASLARGQNASVIVLTSRQSGITELPFGVDFPVRLIRVGGQARDLGITTFQAGRSGGRTEALARVTNFGPTVAQSDLDLFVDGQLADVRPLSIPPGQQRTLTWSSFPPTAQTMHLQLTVHDDFAADKSAWSAVPLPSVHRLLLVSTPDYFLQTALRLDSEVRLTVVAPDVYKPTVARGFDLVVFNGFLPASLPPGPSLIVDPPSGTVGPLRFGAPVKLASIPVTPATPDPTGALLRYVDLSDVHVAAARRAILPSWLPPVATGRTDKGPRTVPLVAAGNTRQGRIAILTFDLQQSDWPLRISFPIAVQNLIHYLVPPPLVDRVTVPVGQQVDIAIRDGVREVDVSLPGGTVERLQLPLSPFGATAEPGLYTVREVSGRSRTTATFAVNFLSPRPAPTSGPPDVLLGNQGSQSARVVSQPIQVSWVFGLLALGILCAEWWFALRR